MSTPSITPEEHRCQIAAYAAEHAHYHTYARALERVLKMACAEALPEVLVQARAKSLPSFAEKCVRKFDKYPDAVRQLTDLCGARVIVQTLAQVQAVKCFVEANFECLERDDKGLLLGEDRFGYRDMHFLIRLNKTRAPLIGFQPHECAEIGERVAELQVRNIVQHAWADILHDRLYKAPLRLSPEARRTGNLLAAIMEDGDRSFDALASEIDGMAANYTAYASRDDVQREIAVQELILANEQDPKARHRLALQLARLLGPCGEYRRAVEMLKPLAILPEEPGAAILLELGHALCRVHQATPQSEHFLRGQHCLRKVIDLCTDQDFTVVPNLRARKSLHARALSRLAQSWEAVPHSETKARDLYRKALAVEPSNPYHLANQLGYELFCADVRGLIDGMQTSLLRAISTCREHTVAGIELPFAAFTAGRLALLLGEATMALGWYARGLRHFFDGQSCVSEDVLDDEEKWIERLHQAATQPPAEHDWIRRLITLVREGSAKRRVREEPAAVPAADRVLIVAGGARSMDATTLQKIRPCLEQALESFRGTVICGGTVVGIPGCVGEIAAHLRQTGRKHFELVGYVPKHLREEGDKDVRYDRFVFVSEDRGFSPEQILRTWEDLRGENISPDRVLVLGLGGGPLARVEYHVALALGASVAVVLGSGGTADEIAADAVWNAVPSLIALPLDPASARAFVTSPTVAYPPQQLEDMARAFHTHYVNDSHGKLPPSLRPWPELDTTFQTANLEQARYAVEILHAAGFDVRPITDGPDVILSFQADAFRADVERMSELEHGRWNVERLRDGWRFGPARDDARKIHPSIVTWDQLPENIRQYDRNSVHAFPEILRSAGLEIYRK